MAIVFVSYAGDLPVIIRTKDDILVDAIRLQLDSDLVCLRVTLYINPNKIIQLLCTNRKKFSRLHGTGNKFSSEVKYLGVILDQIFCSNLKRLFENAEGAIWFCRMLLGETWAPSTKDNLMPFWLF